jgi:tetratricopeptide (TPR) repeat protein
MGKEKFNMIPIICYCFSLFAFGIFIFSLFKGDEILKKQAIYWFCTSVIVIFLPSIEQLRYKDLELKFKNELEQVKDSVDKKTQGLKETCLSVSKQIYPMERDFFDKLAQNDLNGALKVTDSALKTLNTLNRNFPDDINVQTYRAYMLKNRAMIMQRQKKPDESNKCLDEAAGIFHNILEKNPKDAASLNGLGSIYALKRDYETALIYIDKALNIQPDYEAAQHDRKLVINMLRRQKDE